MIVVISPAEAERNALAGLCGSGGWPALVCDSVRSAARVFRRHPPRVLIVRHRLSDGYSDDIFVQLATLRRGLVVRTIVLLEAGTPSAAEVRQLELGADCVLRNPVRMDVLSAYIEKYISRTAPEKLALPPSAEITTPFCGARLSAAEHTLQFKDRAATLTPREVLLAEMLSQAEGTVVSYESLYSDILGRKFQGDTSNMRVLLGKLTASCRQLGIPLRQHVQVIPKSGYRYEYRSDRRR